MSPRESLGAGLAALAVVVGLSMVGVAAAHPEPARFPGAAAGAPPGATPSPSPTTAPSASAVPTSTGFATLPVEDWPTPDVPDAQAVRESGTNDASRPTAVSGGQVRAGDRPVEVRIPAIGVHSRLVDLGIARDGTMEVPSDPARAGWLTSGPAPGQRGPAVIAGHVDTHAGPAVFVRLHELRPGDEVEVTQRDGDVLTFTVRSLAHFPKDAFPTDLVYGPAPGPVLRLITCSGEIDPTSGHYTDNTIVFAS